MAAFGRQWQAITGWKISGGSKSAGVIQLERVRRLAGVSRQTEGYRLLITPQRILLQVVHIAGLRYGLQSLLALLNVADGQWIVPAGEISDWPDFAWRGFLVDPARKFIPLPRLRQYVDWLAQNKMNVLHAHFTDNEGFTVECRRFPALNDRPYHPMFTRTVTKVFTLQELQNVEREFAGTYAREDIRQLVRYAAERGVTVMPELAMPGHAATFLRVFPELKCRIRKGLSGGRKYTNDAIMCLGNEKTYRIIEQLFDDLLPLFPAPIVHIGTDEVDCRDVFYWGNVPWHQRWADCEVCRDRMRQLGYTRVHDLFYYFIRRIHKILARHGKRLMMWNDYIDIAKPVNLPRDILIHYWQIALPKRGPRQGCSFAKFLEAGFEVVNTNSRDTYIDEECLMQERNLLRWAPDTRPRPAAGRINQLLGGELCAWSDWEHYSRTLPIGLAVFGDRVWNRRPVADVPAFARGVARHLFGSGQAPEFYDQFSKFGTIIPPRQKGVRVYTDPVKFTLPETVAKTPSQWRQLVKTIQTGLRCRHVRNRPLLGELLQSAQGREK